MNVNFLSRSMRFALVMFVVVAVTQGLSAQGSPPVNADKHGLALEGYDPVAYFSVGGGKPTKGEKSITAEVDGATYRFISEDHRQLFVDDPAKFTPAFGGWCAYAMADGEKVEVDPKRFEIYDGRLFLFYHTWLTDTLKPWQKNRGELLPRADEHWEEFAGDQDVDDSE